MVVCNKCGSENYVLLTRQNPKGEKGIFHCEKCTGSPVTTQEGAILEALLNVTSKDFLESHDAHND